MMFLTELRAQDPRQTARPAHDRFAPPVDFLEGPEAYRLVMELPGVDPQTLELVLENGELSIKGELPAQAKGGDERWHLRERASGAFERTFRFPADVAGVEAESRHGLLIITVAKAPQAVARKIPVTIVG